MRLHHLALMMCLLGTGTAQAKGPRNAPGQFDYYAVALSWSPDFCASKQQPGQCDVGRKLGFVLHGLWPQFEAGYPQECSTEPLTAAVKATYAPIYPSPFLIGHEWKKHGTCSGLDPAAYFALSDKLRKQLVIPAQFVQPASPVRASPGEFLQAFKGVNKNLAINGLLPFCSKGGSFLSEIHVCFDKAGASRSCSEGEVKRSYKSCKQESFLLQSVR